MSCGQQVGRHVAAVDVDPRLTDYDLLLANLQDLKDGKAIQVLQAAASQLACQCFPSRAAPMPPEQCSCWLLSPPQG